MMTKNQLLLGSTVVLLFVAFLLVLLLFNLNIGIRGGLLVKTLGPGLAIGFGVALTLLGAWYLIRGALVAAGIGNIPKQLTLNAVIPGYFVYATISAVIGFMLTFLIGDERWGVALICLAMLMILLYTFLGIRSLSGRIDDQQG